MNRTHALAHWKACAGDSKEGEWTDDNLAGFFQRFRPNGDGLAEVFTNVAGGDEILLRLLAVYEATAGGWNGSDAYFIVRKPHPLSDSLAKELTESHLRQMLEIADSISRSDVLADLQRVQGIVVMRNSAPLAAARGSLDASIHEVTGDFMRSIVPTDSDALLMGEALYLIACDYYLRDYILWPLYKEATHISEPFLPYFELWKHGSTVRLDDSVATVYLPMCQ